MALRSFGTWSVDVALPADAPLGTFTARADATVEKDSTLRTVGQFRVEEYRAPQFQVDVVSPARELVAGDAVKAEVIARYLFGGGMPSAAVRWTVARESIDFEPPGNAGFTFGPRSWWWDDGEPSRTADVFASGEGETSALGVLALAAGEAAAPAGRTFSYTVEAEVADVSRQRIANRTSLTVHPASVYAGVRRRGTGFAEAGRPDVLEVIAAAPDGARRAGLSVEVTLKRREWKWIRKRGAGGEWFWENEVHETPAGGCRVRTEATPAACPFTAKEPGLFVAEATVKDEKARAQTTRFPFYVIGSGWVSWQREETDRIDLVPDRRTYAPGDVARVLVKSPFPQAEAVVTVEREGVTFAKRVSLAGAATALEVPIGEDDAPNAFVSVVLVRGRVPGADASDADADPGRPQVRVGYAELKVERRQKRLSVSVAPDAAEKRPRDEVRVALEVKDFRGKGVPAEVTVWAVDEGVLRLTGYQAPDPVELVHPPRGLSVRVGEPLLHLVERRRYGEKGETSGGGGGDDGAGAGIRSRFKTTVLFAPEVRTDAQGRATVKIELPDNLTTYRIMAVAVAADDRMGNGEAKVAVSKPLMALPALPRLARAGDRFEAGVVIHAPGGAVRSVEVRAEAVGLALVGAASKSVELVAGKPQEVRFAFRADAPGEARLRFVATGGGERDGVEQKLPVRLPVELEAVAVSGDTRERRREGLATPAGVRPEVGGLEVTFASTALGGFAENARQLVEYPYGCLEQLSSRLVPFVALREIQGKFGIVHQPGEKPGAPPAFLRDLVGEAALRIHETSDPDEVVRRTVKAIETLQNPDGGYRYWPSSECTAEWASSYAVLALGRAAKLGYPVDREGLARGQRYLADTVAAGRCTRCWFACVKPDDATRAFALYALARTDAPKASYYGELLGRRKALPLFAKALLADAMFVGGGDRDDARKLLQELLNHAKESAGKVHFEEVNPRSYAALWSSDPRTTAIVLQTLADVSPDHPYVAKIAAYLGEVRRGDGRFRNTQEAAFALMALAEVARTKERETPDFTARATLGGKAIAESRFAGRTTEVRRTSVAMKDLPAAGGALPFDFARDGKAGVLYYGARAPVRAGEGPAGAARSRALRAALVRAVRGRRAGPRGAGGRPRPRAGARGDADGAAVRGRGGAGAGRARDRGHDAVDDRRAAPGEAGGGPGRGVRRGERGRRGRGGRRGGAAALGDRLLEPLQPRGAARRPARPVRRPAPARHPRRELRRPRHHAGRVRPLARARRGDVRAGDVRTIRRGHLPRRHGPPGGGAVTPAGGARRRAAARVALAAAAVAALCALGFVAAPLPAGLLARRPAAAVRFTDRSGRLLREVASRADGRSLPLPLDEPVPPLVRAAFVAAEDARFERHPGVDPLAAARAAWQLATRRRVVSGASTLTMQLARQLVPHRRGLAGKVGEALWALRLEAHLSKDEILRAYLDRVWLGNGTWGVEAASALYFARPARTLSAAQAALLAGMTRSPSGHDPYRRPAPARARMDEVLARMVKLGALDPAVARASAAAPLDLVPPERIFEAPHLVDALVAALPALGLEAAAEVETTVDPGLQRDVEEIVRAELAGDARLPNAAAIVVDNATGEVLAYVGSADFLDAEREGQNDGVRALRQPGSALKPFAYGLALARGYTPATLLSDVEVHLATPTGDWVPRNYDRRVHGPVRLRAALQNSYNVPAVRLAEALGPEAILRVLRAAGLESLDAGAERYGAGLVLGNGDVTLRQLARAYRGLARGGLSGPLVEVRAARDAGGLPLPVRPEGRARRFLPAPAVALLTDILSDETARAPAFGLSNALRLPFPVAAKTGTSRAYVDNWAAGYTAERTVAVWVGSFDGAPMRGVSGITGAGPVFARVMVRAMRGISPAPLRDRSRFERARVCALSGRRAGAACPGAIEEVFLPGTAPSEPCAMHRRGQAGAELDVGPEYYAWARAEGIAAGPRAGEGVAAGGEARLLLPRDGDEYLVEAGFPEGAQEIPVRVQAPPGVSRLEVRTGDGAVTLAPPFTGRLPARPGRHRVEVWLPGARAPAAAATYVVLGEGT